MQVGEAEIVILSQYLASLRAINHYVLWTIMTMRVYNSVAGNNDEVYDKKSQRYAKDNKTAFNFTQ